MKIVTYTPEIQEITGIETKAEPWLHFGFVPKGNKLFAAIWVWDTREIIECKEIGDTMALIDQVAAQPVANDNLTELFLSMPPSLSEDEMDTYNDAISPIVEGIIAMREQLANQISGEFDNIVNLGKKFGKRQAIKYINDMVRKLSKEFGSQSVVTATGTIFDGQPMDITSTEGVNALYSFLMN